MSSNHNKLADAGYPAFPCTVTEGWGDNQTTVSYDGMTLRDYFAAQAIAGGIARVTLPEYDLKAIFGDRGGITREEILAADAYRVADAMLQRRKR